MMLRCALAALFGGLTTLGFAPYEWPVLSLLGIAGLIELWRTASAGRAALYGFCFGLAHFASGVYWVFISTHRYGGAPLWLGVWLVLVLSTYMSLYPTLLGWLATRWRARSTGLWALLQLPALWTLLELVRAYLGTGFTWLSLGYAFIDTPLDAAAPVLGVHGMSGLALLVAGALWLLWRGALRERWAAVAVLAAAATALALLPQHESWTEPTERQLKVGIVQGNIPQDVKWEEALRIETKQRYLDLSEDLDSVPLLIWPEAAIPATYEEEQPFLEMLGEWAAERNQTLLTGVLLQDGNDLYNTILAVGEGQGKDGRFYLKRHLVPFGEFFPIPDFLRVVMQGLDMNYGDFTHGPALQTPIVAAGETLGISICFEAAFGREIRRALPEATVLITVTNDGWFDGSAAPWQHLQIARLRALESGREIVRVSNRGVSGVIGADGALRETIPFFETGAREVQIQPRTGATPYARFGDWPLWLLSGLLSAAAFWLRRA